MRTASRCRFLGKDGQPSNILVTPQGRVVILDFGIISDLHRLERWDEYRTMGTVAYMAPEQADARPVGPAADWYSVGVVLYEALTGTLPFSGQPAEILERKREGSPPPPRSLVPGVPAALDQLCGELLRSAPEERISGEEVLRRLQIEQPAEVNHSYVPHHPFIGRHGELELLERAFTDSRRGPAVTIQVHGESGVGKSFLVRYFLDTIARKVPETVLLSGRCYERELLPYKAVDGVVDQLSRYLAQLPQAEVGAILPRNLPLLAKLFPVLEPMAALAQSAGAPQMPEDPVVLRGRAFQVLRELLANIAQRTPLVVMIDDLQWADTDSFVLLGELLRPPSPPSLLLVATVRDSTASVDLTGGSLEVARLPGDVRRLPVGKLPEEEAQELVQRLLATAPEGDKDVAALIAREAKGHPLYIDELVRQRRIPGQQNASLRLDDALWARVQRLDAPARQLMEAVAVAGVPIAQELIARAAAVSPDQFDALTAQLRAAHLVRTMGARQKDAIVAYHDRVRESILANLDKDARTDWHSRLAVALENAGAADPEALLLHWQEAGNTERAAGYAIKAAEQAAGALAFARAASLYQKALELKPLTGSARGVLLEKLATALTNANRGAEAAPVFLSAAADAAPDKACDLQRRAADQFLISGHIDEGMQVLEQVLAAVGLKMGSSSAQVLASLLWRRARLRLRGNDFTPRPAAEIPADKLLRIDVCWAVSRGLAMVDTLRATDFQSLHLMLALDAGEPYRVVRGLAMEVALRSTEGGPSRQRVDQLAATARELAAQVKDPHALGLTILVSGTAAFLRGEWSRALALMEESQDILLERCIGIAWEWANMHRFALGALMYLGQIRELRQRVHVLLAGAKETGNRYIAADMRLRYHIAWLAVDDPEGARRQIEEGLADWSHQGFHVQHYHVLLGLVQLALYQDRPAEGWARIQKTWPELKGSLMLRIQFIRCEATHLRGRSALAYLAHGGPVAALTRQIESTIHQIEKEQMAWTTPLATLLRAGLAHCRKDTAAAVGHLRAAIVGLDGTQTALYAAAARWRLSALLPADSAEGRQLREQAERFLAEQEIRNPARIVAMLVPGFPSESGLQ